MALSPLRRRRAGRVFIFDVDGTLVDSNDAHARAWSETLHEFGLSIDVATVRRLVGMGGDKLLPALTGIDADSPRGREIARRRQERFRRVYLPQLRPFPGTRALFQSLRAKQVRTAVASSSNKEDLDLLLEIAGVADLLDDRASADDAERSKPDPDIIQAALARLGDTADVDVTMVGDTPYDIQAAQKAGVRAVAFRCGGWTDPDLRGADLIFDGPADLLARLDDALASP